MAKQHAIATVHGMFVVGFSSFTSKKNKPMVIINAMMPNASHGVPNGIKSGDPMPTFVTIFSDPEKCEHNIETCGLYDADIVGFNRDGAPEYSNFRPAASVSTGAKTQ